MADAAPLTPGRAVGHPATVAHLLQHIDLAAGPLGGHTVTAPVMVIGPGGQVLQIKSIGGHAEGNYLVIELEAAG